MGSGGHLRQDTGVLATVLRCAVGSRQIRFRPRRDAVWPAPPLGGPGPPATGRIGAAAALRRVTAPRAGNRQDGRPRASLL